MGAKEVVISFVKTLLQIVICYSIWVSFDNQIAKVIVTILGALTLNALIISICQLYDYLKKSLIRFCKKGLHDK